MRLINLDDAVKALEQAYPNDGQMSCHDAVAVIGTVPTIEPRKGKWEVRGTIFEDEEAECSECGFAILVNEPGNGLPELSNLQFCPYCGARMTEGGEDETV